MDTYDSVARKRQWIDKYKFPQPDLKAELHGRKIMCYVLWDRRGITHFELLNRNKTVTSDLYVQQLQRLLQTYMCSSSYSASINVCSESAPHLLIGKILFSSMTTQDLIQQE